MIVIRKRVLWILFLLAAALLAAFLMFSKSQPPEIPLVKTGRENIVSTLQTNGKVEPIEWASARASRRGVVQKIYVQKGQRVHLGDPLVGLDTWQETAAIASAAARVSAAQAERDVLNQGGRLAEITDIDNSLSRAHLDLMAAQHEHEVLRRLVDKQAAPRHDLEDITLRVNQLQLEIKSLERRRAALVAPTDKTIAEAKLNEAETARTLAENGLALSVVRAPSDGVVYQFELRIGSFLNPGDLVANVGRLDQVRAVIYVDEPDLGRVERGMPVTIRWDAAPLRQWQGKVAQLPAQVVALGTRQVGEVSCIIDNPDLDLLPGTNIDAAIQSRVVGNALTIPKETLRRQRDMTGVMMLRGDHLAWQPVQLGVSTLTKVQVTKGLNDGDSVALPTDKPIKEAMKITPLYP